MKSVPKDHGLVVIGVKSNTYFQEVIIAGPKTTKIDRALLKQADPYILVSLPAGNYEFSTINLNKNFYINLNFSESTVDWTFDIKPGVITYVGDFVVTSRAKYRYYSRLVNNSSAALQYLEEKHPKILEENQLVYAGTDKDYFFPYISKLKGDAK